MTNLRTLTGIVLASTALATGGTVIAAAPATAMPQNCSTYTNVGFYGRSFCEYGSGSHRVRVYCKRIDGSGFYKYGPWVGTGSVSRADCNARSSIVQVQGD